MATSEPEITQPVDLCLPGGKVLNPAARGWSRTPLHTGNLRGRWGRTKRWDYWAILAGDWSIAIVYADVDYLGIAEVWWCHLPTGETGGRAANVPGARGIALPDRPGSAPLRYESSKIEVALTDDPEGTTIAAWWTDGDGQRSSLNARIDLPAGHESLNVVIPWSDKQFQYTSKHQARPAHGTLEVGDQVVHFGSSAASAAIDAEVDPEGTHRVDEAWGVLDVGRGRWPYETRWNWGGGAGRSAEGAVVGIQIGAKWTEGTGFTENGVIVDGVLTKIGEELTWDYRWEQPLEPWRVHHPDGSFDLTLTPTYDKHSQVKAVVMGTEVHQVFGTWSGHVTTDTGAVHHVDGLQGFAEESRSRW
ncbi:DUF2804 domain-containing protein [Aquihabitans sp. McL0605]|uniref:DUF2804 domain-containing protein n=1 Tax=Aquihabitans sp. McL0605 TaxID=3415671 RepID=UPI003CF3F9F6